MITRDHLLRQVQQLAQVLALVLFHKRAGRDDEAQEVLAETLKRATGLEMDRLRQLSREELLTICTPGESSGLAVSLADLLREDETRAGHERALWLYEAVLASGEAVPADIYDRIDDLRASLGE